MRWPEASRRCARWFGLALGLGALVWVAVQAVGNGADAARTWQELASGRFAAAVAWCLLSQILFALAWHVLAHGRWRKSGVVADVLRWAQSLPGKYLPGKIWQGVARGALYAEDGRAGPALLLFLREQCLSLGLCAALAAMYAPAALPARTGAWLQSGLLCVALGLTAAGVWRRWPTAWLTRLRPSWRGWERDRPPYRAIAWAWVVQGGAYAALCAGFVSLAWDVEPSMALLQAAAAMCLAGLAGVAAVFVPAGLGVREAGLVWGLAPLIGVAEAAALALFWRVAVTSAEVAFAGAGFVVPLLQRR